METDSTNSFPNIDRYLYNEFYATDTSFEKSLDLDAFFGYRKDKSGEIIKEDPDHKPNRIFISKLDMFNTLHIAQFFSKRKYGDTLVGEEGEGDEEGGEEEEEPGEGGKEGEGDEVKEKNDSKSKIPSESKLKEKTKKASIDVESLFENFTEYEYIDALYAKYDVSKLNVLEYGELLNLDNHEERLLYLEKKFGVLKKKYLVDSSTSIEQLITEKKPKKGKQTSMYYELVGTIANSKQEAYYRELIPCLVEILSYNQTDERHYLSRLMKCGGYVFDITQNPAVINEARFVLNAIVDKFMYLEETSPKEFPTMNIKIAFILISPLMTWAATKPIDPEEPDLPFTEKDFKKRKPHPNYKDHFELEKELYAAVLKYPNKLKGYVIGTGGIYGYEETFLHYLFKLAWLNEEELPVLGKGKNKIPLIHIDDLAMIVHLVISNLPKNKYVFAIEKSVSTLKEVTKAVSKVLGSGRVGKVSKEHAFLIPEITQPFYDLLTANFNMESNVLDELNMPWRTEQGFVENIKQLVKEYKAARKLKAIKILVVGPPGGGKTRISKKLSEHYQINYITLQKGIDTFMHNLKSKIAASEKRIADKARLEEEKRLKAENKPNEDEGEEEEEPVEEEEDDEDEEEADDESALEGLKEKLAAAQQKIESSGGQLEDEDAIRFVKATLTSRPCQNQGYVLDGYPTTLKQTVALFSIGGEGEEEAEEVEEEEEPEKNENENEGEGDEGAEAIKINKKTIPDIVICLEACDDHLYKTLLRHPEVVKQKVSEQDIFNSIRKYRKMNTTESTLLLFFDELERYPYILDVEHDKTADLDKVMERILTLVGQPCNYEAELLKQLQQKQKQDAARKYHEAKCQKQKHIRTLRKEAIKKKLEMWAAEVDRMKEEEEEILAKESVPLRHYLIKFIFPTLTNGLIEVARVQPEDPIDYLAEFLFKENPDGRMFLEDREEPTEIKKMINMLFDFKNYLQYTTHNTDVSSFIHDKP